MALNGKVLKLIADSVATAICHIINTNFINCLCPAKWKITT